MLTEAQRRRIAGARLDPPVAGRVGGAIVFVAGAGGLAWTLARHLTPSLDVIILVLGVAVPGWVGMTSLIREYWVPLVVLLGRRLEERQRGSAARQTSGGLAALDVLTRTERRDLVATRIGAAEGRRRSWALTWWLVLGLAGFCAAVDLWQLRNAASGASVDFLACVSLIGLGSFVAERSRWRPIVATLREALGEAAWSSTFEGRGDGTHPSGRAESVPGLRPFEEQALARASRDPLRRSFTPLGITVLAVLLLWGTARGLQAPSWPLQRILTALLAVVATFEAGYVLARSRWRHGAPGPRGSARPGPSPSRPPEDAGE